MFKKNIYILCVFSFSHETNCFFTNHWHRHPTYVFCNVLHSSPGYIFRLIFFTYTNFGLFPILIFTYKKNHGAHHKQQHQKCPHFEDKVEQGRNENAKTRLKRLCMRGSNMVRMKKGSALKLVVMSNKA